MPVPFKVMETALPLPKVMPPLSVVPPAAFVLMVIALLAALIGALTVRSVSELLVIANPEDPRVVMAVPLMVVAPSAVPLTVIEARAPVLKLMPPEIPVAPILPFTIVMALLATVAAPTVRLIRAVTLYAAYELLVSVSPVAPLVTIPAVEIVNALPTALTALITCGVPLTVIEAAVPEANVTSPLSVLDPR